ncbi:MAG: ATP-dependent helicase [Chloroflexota bacterium]
MTTPVELRSMLRNEVAIGEHEVVRLTEGQYQTLHMLRGVRRASIVGGAGTGKTMLAAEKARRLAREGFETLLICFNAPLARMLADDVAEVATSTERLTVSTFHQLCQDLGREADVIGERPDPVPPSWWSETLPNALVEAAERLGPRYHAVVVDEGQDFAPDWLLALEALSFGGKEDVLYVFHDPAQAIYREDVVGQLGLQEYSLGLNCRNAQSIHALVARFAQGGLESDALRDDGRAPELIEADGEADGEAETLEALRKVLHRLRVEEDVAPWHIAVLTGARLEASAVWRKRQFGNEVLANPAIDDEGRHLGAPAHETPELPSDAILCETIRRFKGLERPVVILVELEGLDADMLDRLLYVGASRARQHLVVIGPPAVLERLR